MSLVPIYQEHVDALLAIAEHANERELLLCATRSAALLLGDRGSCVLVDGRARVVLSTATPSLVDLPIKLEKYPEVVASVERRASVMIEDAHEHPLLHGVRAFLPGELRSVAVVPLLGQQRCFGVLMAQSAAPRHFAPEAVATAELIGALTGRLIALQRRAQRDARPFDATVESNEEARGPRRVLIVDDDVELATSLAQLLHEREGYDVRIAHDGEAGLALANAQSPDLMVLDVVMPGLDGYAIAERLTEDPITCDVPILFLSASESLVTRVRELKLRNADFLTKPFTSRELLARVERSMQQLALRERLRQAAYTDELTGLGNLRLFHDRIAIEEARSVRYGTSLALLVLDVDRLKKINDEHGHAAGSEALKAIGSVLKSGAREMDVAVRYGGDEFVVLLPHSTLADARGFAQRVLERLRELRPAGLKVTMSMGIAATVAGYERSLTGLIEKADAALYRAKRLGGDRFCVDESTPSSPASKGTVAGTAPV